VRFLVALLAAAAALMTGCRTEPIYEVAQAPVVTPGITSPSMDDVTKAIVRGGTLIGWQMSLEQPGRMTGRYVRGRHNAIVDVTYDTKSYSIKHRDSSLARDSGEVHRVYNGWVQSLERSIRSELAYLK